MPDPRFFAALGPVSLATVLELTGAVAERDRDLDFQNVATLVRATRSSITFLADPKFASDLAESRAGACLVRQRDVGLVPDGCLSLLSTNPQAAYAVLAAHLHPSIRHSGRLAVSEACDLEDEVEIGPGVVIGQGARIGRGTVLGANCVIGPGVTIGRGSVIGPGAVISHAMLGDRVKVYVNATLGEAGFGATGAATGVIDIPQLGRVIVQDGVTIGAGCCIDRGAYEDTVIGENTKIDNLVHIAHNVRIGRNCLIAAQVGIAGSAVIGDGVAFGGQAGIADHIIVGEGARVGAAAGVLRDVPAGQTWSGFPAQPVQDWLRSVSWIRRGSARRPGGSDQ